MTFKKKLAARKKYRQINNNDTGEALESIDSTSEKYGLAGSNICKCCIKKEKLPADIY